MLFSISFRRFIIAFTLSPAYFLIADADAATLMLYAFSLIASHMRYAPLCCRYYCCYAAAIRLYAIDAADIADDAIDSYVYAPPRLLMLLPPATPSFHATKMLLLIRAKRIRSLLPYAIRHMLIIF